ncbi:MAG: efflux RND transporter permease subunit [Deltaproteobacteria bacterium]|nr:efflux RND transporter permease subunit [Deltaproteobacteria bacterium]
MLNDEVKTHAHAGRVARYFVENKQLAWLLLVCTLAWGVFAYQQMPKRKDPVIPFRFALLVCPWPAAKAEKVEQLVTRKLEAKIAENAKVERIESISRNGFAVVQITIDERVTDVGKELDDIQLKLDAVSDLPEGAGPVRFYKDFGDTASLLVTLASPPVSEVDLMLRAREVRRGLASARAAAPRGGARRSVVVSFAHATRGLVFEREQTFLATKLEASGLAQDLRLTRGSGFVAVDFALAAGPRADEQLGALVAAHAETYLQPLHPDVWPPIVVPDLEAVEGLLTATAGARYTYRELDDYSEALERTLRAAPSVAKVIRTGVRPEAVYLSYSQERLAAYDLAPAQLKDLVSARNIAVPGGVLPVSRKNLTIDPRGALTSEDELAAIIAGASPRGSPVYLRDVVDVTRSYEDPPRVLNHLAWRDADGGWRRSRAVSLAVYMRQNQQIAAFGAAVEGALSEARALLPPDLVLARVSDQPRQVAENVDLFMKSLYEAVLLVIAIALIGFWEWRSSLIMAVSIPLTLAMTFGFMHVLGVDLQQVSIGSLIIALGLLVDDPVVAGDAIKHEIARGHSARVAAWLGPTKLAKAILFATLINIVAYLPLLLLKGDIGRFIHTLPVVLACSLVASRLVSMTFVPLLGSYLPATKREEDKPRPAILRGYARLAHAAIAHRRLVLFVAVAALAASAYGATRLERSFFPKDLSYLFYVDVWLPEDAPLSATDRAAADVEAVIREQAAGREAQLGRRVVDSVSTYVGAGSPRFWFSLIPEQQQLNFAQLVVTMHDKHDTLAFVAPLQEALSARVSGARVDVRELETGEPVGVPVSIRFAGESIEALRAIAEEAKAILRAVPEARRVRDDWGPESFVARLEVDADRANLAGVTNLDVAVSSVSAMNGMEVGALREGSRNIPIIARMRPAERARLADLSNLYVYSTRSNARVPLGQVSHIDYALESGKLRARNHFRTITVSAFPAAYVLPAAVLERAMPALEQLRGRLPPGYAMQVGGEHEAQSKAFGQVALAMIVSVALIFLTLAIELRHVIKPLIVFAAIPFGVVGALLSLSAMQAPFGFMAFLGIASLTGVIVSHVIVLFEFIEEERHRGRPLEEALIEAGVARMRPVVITVAATVFALFPLAAHGGPLWEPLCFAQIGGLTIATLITLVLVPVLYAVCVRDLRAVRWP